MSEESVDDDDSDESGDRPLEANVSFGEDKYDETVMQRVEPPVDEYELNDEGETTGIVVQVEEEDEAIMCAVGNTHLMML